MQGALRAASAHVGTIHGARRDEGGRSFERRHVCAVRAPYARGARCLRAVPGALVRVLGAVLLCLRDRSLKGACQCATGAEHLQCHTISLAPCNCFCNSVYRVDTLTATQTLCRKCFCKATRLSCCSFHSACTDAPSLHAAQVPRRFEFCGLDAKHGHTLAAEPDLSAAPVAATNPPAPIAQPISEEGTASDQDGGAEQSERRALLAADYRRCGPLCRASPQWRPHRAGSGPTQMRRLSRLRCIRRNVCAQPKAGSSDFLFACHVLVSKGSSSLRISFPKYFSQPGWPALRQGAVRG